MGERSMGRGFVRTRLSDDSKREQIRVEREDGPEGLIEIADDRVTSRAERRQIMARPTPSTSRVYLTEAEAVFVRDVLVEELGEGEVASGEGLHVLLVQSESGDDYGPFLFRKKPDDAELLSFLRKHTPPDDSAPEEPGAGWGGTYLHLRWTQSAVY